MQLKIGYQGDVRSAMALIVVGIRKQIPGLKIALRETADRWKDLLQQHRDEGLKHGELSTSDAHDGGGGGLPREISRLYLGPRAGTLPVERGRQDAIELPGRYTPAS